MFDSVRSSQICCRGERSRFIMQETECHLQTTEPGRAGPGGLGAGHPVTQLVKTACGPKHEWNLARMFQPLRQNAGHGSNGGSGDLHKVT